MRLHCFSRDRHLRRCASKSTSFAAFRFHQCQYSKRKSFGSYLQPCSLFGGVPILQLSRLVRHLALARLQATKVTYVSASLREEFFTLCSRPRIDVGENSKLGEPTSGVYSDGGASVRDGARQAFSSRCFRSSCCDV